MNKFLDAMQHQPTAFTENGAVAYGDTGSDLVNYFSNVNNLERSYKEVSHDLNVCWGEDPLLTLRMIVYVRAITRRTVQDVELNVKGLGIKNEGRLALKWLYNNHRAIFHKNLPLFIAFGCWKDLWHKDLIDWVKESDMVVANYIGTSIFEDDLCRKYLPRYKSKSNLTRRTPSATTLEYKKLKNKGLSLVVRAINERLSGAGLFKMKHLMQLKARGKAHSWQQAISKQQYLGIDFDTLPGKVLTWITKETDNGSFLSRHGLEDAYIEWLDKKGGLNTTSYIYELVQPAIDIYENYWSEKTLSRIQKYTIEKQIQTILERAEASNLNVMPVIDTSGSMSLEVNGAVTALDICLSLGVYFSMLQKGSFKDHIIAFDSTSEFKRLSGGYLDRLQTILKDQDYMGSTNFQSVIDLILETRANNPDVPIEDYPDVYLVISDMAFNACGSQTNHQAAINKLTQAGLPEPIFIWYNVSPYGNDNFQNHKDDAGVIHMSGFDPAAVDRLMSADFQLKFEQEKGKSITEITPYEAMKATLEQDYLKLITL